MIRLVAAACLLPALLSGCAFKVGLDAASSQAPGTLAEIEQLKTAVVTAPLAGCVATVQQADMLLKALSTGTPAIPISSTPAPPILTVPAPAPPPTATPPVIVAPLPIPAPSPTTGGPPPFPASPTVTPSARHRASVAPRHPFDFSGSSFVFDERGSAVPIARAEATR